MRPLHATLIDSDEKRGYLPGIATDWKVSPDGKTWTVTIRDGVKFHDGKPVTAEDVYFSWLQSWGPGSLDVATSASAINMALNTEKIDLVSLNQVSITHKNADASFPAFISDVSGSCQGHVTPAWDFAKIRDAALIQAYDAKPISTGQVKMVRHVPEEVMAFERFDDYYYQPKNGFPEDRRTKFRFMDLRKVPEEATRAATVRAGEADIAPISLATRKQVEAGGGRVVFGQEDSYIYIKLMGPWLPEFPISKKEVRQALSYAMDLRVMRDRLFGAAIFQPKGHSFVTPSSIGYSPELDPVFDPNKARQLMAAAGYPGGKGVKLVLNTWSSRAVPFLPESAQLAADMWRKELGIEVEVKLGDETALKKVTNSDDDLYGQLLWRENEAVVDGGSSFRSAYASPRNLGRAHNDPDLLKQATEAMGVIDPTLRTAALNKIYRRLVDENYQIGIGYINVPWGLAPRVLEWKPRPMAFYPSALHTIVLKP
jgi:peptide/nickel transport system substrate-binding protein